MTQHKLHIYKMTEWKDAVGRWHCNDVEDLANNSGAWWIPCRILEISPADFILTLKNKYHADYISYNKKSKILLYSWESQLDMRRFKNHINQIAREKNFMI